MADSDPKAREAERLEAAKDALSSSGARASALWQEIRGQTTAPRLTVGLTPAEIIRDKLAFSRMPDAARTCSRELRPSTPPKPVLPRVGRCLGISLALALLALHVALKVGSGTGGASVDRGDLR